MFQSHEINNCLLQSLADLLLFLEFSSEDQVNPDAAVQAMEQLSATLQQLSDIDKDNLVLAFKKLSSQYGGGKADFIANIGEHLGLE